MYEYRCERCGKVIEVLQKYSDAPLVNHEDCGGKLEKLISQSAFQLKGSGWYATDYPHRSPPPKSDKGESKGESKEHSASESKSESSSESKTESKTEKTESKPAAPAKSE
jgi:putative FmdB family regulatory protein